MSIVARRNVEVKVKYLPQSESNADPGDRPRRLRVLQAVAVAADGSVAAASAFSDRAGQMAEASDCSPTMDPAGLNYRTGPAWCR
jgi:hypothetical protein